MNVVRDFPFPSDAWVAEWDNNIARYGMNPVCLDGFLDTMDVTMRIKENPDAEQVGMVMKAVANETDLGDHAEGQGTFTTSMEGIGDLMTITINKKTDIAEAYIITPDAVQPMAMSEEELNAFGQEISTNAMMVLISVLPKLPQGLQQMLMGQ